ncbi:hypothetical protein SN10121_12440 [Ligilactobacillus agilis]|nr:hypothetical protein SN10121_12440 [Ligilactobacillus agilis]
MVVPTPASLAISLIVAMNPPQIFMVSIPQLNINARQQKVKYFFRKKPKKLTFTFYSKAFIIKMYSHVNY